MKAVIHSLHTALSIGGTSGISVNQMPPELIASTDSNNSAYESTGSHVTPIHQRPVSFSSFFDAPKKNKIHDTEKNTSRFS